MFAPELLDLADYHQPNTTTVPVNGVSLHTRIDIATLVLDLILHSLLEHFSSRT